MPKLTGGTNGRPALARQTSASRNGGFKVVGKTWIKPTGNPGPSLKGAGSNQPLGIMLRDSTNVIITDSRGIPIRMGGT